jgi:hypothetical protein
LHEKVTEEQNAVTRSHRGCVLAGTDAGGIFVIKLNHQAEHGEN